ncbi:MAG: type II toxin-antitoxin system HipA family toxin [Deltaproteobacteria bacterium]
MKSSKSTQVDVWLDDPSFGPLQRIGVLSQGDRGSVRFAYDAAWLAAAHAFPLDPELDLSPGSFYPGKSNFGVFMDSCPDRWGQLLMRRREAIEAGEEGRKARTLGPWDFLLGVQDETRTGALRFAAAGTRVFLACEPRSAPPIARIAELQAVAHELSRREGADPDSARLREWLDVLVAPGSSLGGARPKANVVAENGKLWIAKFPAADDGHDVAAWEMVIHDLARQSGLDVPEARLTRVGKGYRTFLVERFDRVGARRRFYASAMTLLGRNDSDDASYLEIAEFLSSYADPEHLEADLAELFTRVVFNVCVANRDDHLRNHGMFRTPAGWRLAPAFDMNPSFSKKEHVLALDLDERRPDLDVVLSTAPHYRLTKHRAVQIVDRIRETVSGWEAVARANGLSPRECAEAKHLFIGIG